jgi:hypothetical protein
LTGSWVEREDAMAAILEREWGLTRAQANEVVTQRGHPCAPITLGITSSGVVRFTRVCRDQGDTPTAVTLDFHLRSQGSTLRLAAPPGTAAIVGLERCVRMSEDGHLHYLENGRVVHVFAR